MTGVDLGDFTTPPAVALDPAEPAIVGVRLVLADLATTIATNWQGAIDHTDPEFLHDLRIAVRRTRTVLTHAKPVLPAAVRYDARREFGWLADLTSTPRDLDVFLLEWPGYTAPLGAGITPLLEPVRELLERRRADAHLELGRGLRSERAGALMRSWTTWLADPLDADALPQQADRPLGRLIARRIARAHGVLLEGGRSIGPEAPADRVHELRKEAKELRYLCECFASLLVPRARTRYVRRLKALQEVMGAHQDADVHIGMLGAVADELHGTGAPAAAMVAIGQLVERIDQQRRAARTAFATRFGAFDTSAVQRNLDAMTRPLGA